MPDTVSRYFCNPGRRVPNTSHDALRLQQFQHAIDQLAFNAAPVLCVSPRRTPLRKRCWRHERAHPQRNDIAAVRRNGHRCRADASVGVSIDDPVAAAGADSGHHRCDAGVRMGQGVLHLRHN